jgi:tetratricopeptide (TPR) repeat protein
LSQTTENTKEFVDELRRQVEDSLNRGDARSAKQILDALLQIVPDDAEALARLRAIEATEAAVESVEEVDPVPTAEPDLGVPMSEELGLSTPESPGGPDDLGVPMSEELGLSAPDAPAESSDLDFDLDLDLEEGPSAGAASSNESSEEGAGGKFSQHEIEMDDRPVIPVIGVGDAPAESESAAVDGDAETSLPAPDPQSGEVALLVSRGEEALAAGNVDEAMSLASRAMAMSEDAPGASGLLARAREEQNRRHGEVETAVSTAVSELESDRPEAAIPLLEKALELMPDHMEAQQYLERARAEVAGEGAAAEEGLDAAPPELAPLDSSGIDPSELAGGDPVSDVGLAPSWESPDAAEVPPPPSALTGDGRPMSPSRGGRAATASGGSRSKTLIGAIVVIAALSAGGWFAFQSLFGGETDGEGVAAASLSAGAETAAAGTGGETAAEPEAASGEEEAGDGVVEATPERPSLQQIDTRALMTEAQALSDAGRHEEAVTLLERALEAAPTDFDVIDRLESERQTVAKSRQAASRIASAREAFETGGYEEALRLLYRIPDEHKPQDVELWIANGWYNMGLQAMQMGNTAEAIQFFGDCLNLNSADEEAAKHREVALRYRRRQIDDAFKIYVSNLEPRAIDVR